MAIKIIKVTDTATLLAARSKCNDPSLELYTSNTSLYIAIGLTPDLEQYISVSHSKRFPSLEECIELIGYFWGTDLPAYIFVPCAKDFSRIDRFNRLLIYKANVKVKEIPA